MTKTTGLLQKVKNWLPTSQPKPMAVRQSTVRNRYHAGGNKQAFRHWNPALSSANTDLEPDREKLLSRCRDARQNQPLAQAAINRTATNTIFTGIKPIPSVDEKILGISKDEAAELNERIGAEWGLFAETPDFDTRRTQNFYQQQFTAFASMLTDGDIWVTTPMFEPTIDRPYSITCNLVEMERVRTPDGMTDSDRLIAGVEYGGRGQPIAVHVINQHPYGDTHAVAKPRKFTRHPIYGRSTGRRRVLHLYNPYAYRAGQTRGVSFIAPILGLLKQENRWTEAELTKAISQAFFTAFVKTGEIGTGQSPLFPQAKSNELDENMTVDSDQFYQRYEYYHDSPDFVLGQGTFAHLLPEDDIVFPPMSQPNPALDTFTNILSSQIGAALGVPGEVIMQRFASSYSAARAALNEAWKLYLFMRQSFNWMLGDPVYDLFLDEAVARKRLILPDYNDPLKRRAYARKMWRGLPQQHIDEEKAARAAKTRIDAGISSEHAEAENMGHDWKSVKNQRVTEVQFNQVHQIPTAAQPRAPMPIGAEELEEG